MLYGSGTFVDQPMVRSKLPFLTRSNHALNSEVLTGASMPIALRFWDMIWQVETQSLQPVTTCRSYLIGLPSGPMRMPSAPFFRPALSSNSFALATSSLTHVPALTSSGSFHEAALSDMPVASAGLM